MIIQVFDKDISSLAIAKTVKIMLLPKPVDKISMTSLLWRTTVSHFPFRLQYNCPVFPSNIQDRRCSAPVNVPLIFCFCFAEIICSVRLNSPMGDYQNIWLTGEHLNQSERSVRWRTDRLKKAPRPCRRFFKLLPPQSPRGFSALAHLYYLARPTKTAMLRRLPHLKIYAKKLQLGSKMLKEIWKC